MACELLNKGYVGAPVQEAGAKRVAQKVRCEVFLYAAALAQALEQLRHVIARQPSWIAPSGDKESRVDIRSPF
jgi:hypothetical protein